jgi:hypothetical protein
MERLNLIFWRGGQIAKCLFYLFCWMDRHGKEGKVHRPEEVMYTLHALGCVQFPRLPDYHTGY